MIQADAVLLAFSAYLALITMTLLVSFVAPLNAFLGQIIVIQLKFPEMRTGLGYVTPAEYGRRINLLAHAGAILTYASVIAYLITAARACTSPAPSSAS